MNMQSLSLDGPWKLRWFDGEHGGHQRFARQENITAPYRCLDATVPGEVHLDLVRHGLIGDPTLGVNALAARWVQEMMWTYRREFDCPSHALEARCWLHFERLDLAAVILLNGEQVGKHCNTHYPCRIDVTGKLRPGRNLLVVEIESGVYYARNFNVEGHSMWPHTQRTKRNWLRKPQCQFNWDWATDLVNVGLSGSVSLQWTSAPVRVDQFVPMATLHSDLQTGRVLGRLFVENLTGKPITGELKLQVKDLSGASAAASVNILPGLHPIEVSVPVTQPELWWPAGQGPQKMYEVSAELKVADQSHIQRARIGFRKVVINQDAHPAGGNNFTIEVNGRKIFAKGSNFVPADIIFQRIDRARYRKLISEALAANFNFLRIWGGGMYESDDFYKECDEAGIMVWQDFAFANASYPTYVQSFYDDIKVEARYNLRRLAKHPSLIIWCGNNEIEDGMWRHNYDKDFVAPDYLLWHLTFPRIVAEEDPDKFYWPSSPYTSSTLPPQHKLAGDQHPWELGNADTDYRKYRPMICRFASEGGILGPVSLPTMRACLVPGKGDIHSFAWQCHDNGVDTWTSEPSSLDMMVKAWFGVDIDQLDLEQYTYMGGLLKAEGLKEYCESFRYKMYDCSAAVFWMFNDYWPAVRSWTIVDYYLNRTPAFHHVRRGFTPVHVILSEAEGRIRVHGINDTPSAVTAEVRFGLFTMNGQYPLDDRQKVELPANASVVLAEFDAPTEGENAPIVPFAMLYQNQQVIARNRLLRGRYDQLHCGQPDIAIRVSEGMAYFRSERYIMDLCLDLDGKDNIADNFFDLYPQMEYAIPWTAAQPPRVLFAMMSPP